MRTAWLRADVLPPQARDETRALLRQYVYLRVRFVQQQDRSPEHVEAWRLREQNLQRRMWAIATANTPRDDVGALYVESLGEVFIVDALRIAIGIQARVPGSVWAVLCALTILGMVSMAITRALPARNAFASHRGACLSVRHGHPVDRDARPPWRHAGLQQPLIDAGAFMGRP